MAAMVFAYSPNSLTGAQTANSATWQVLGSPNATTGVITGYASVTALLAASDTPFPKLDAGFFLQGLSLFNDSGVASPLTAGAGFYLAFNQKNAPANDTQGIPVLGGVYKIYGGPGRVNNIWIRKITGTDRVWLEATY